MARVLIKRVERYTEVSIDDIEDQADETYEPTAVLRAKAERLGEYLGITADEAEQLIFARL